MSHRTRVLVTGSTGFLGAHVHARLVDDDRYDVVTLPGRHISTPAVAELSPDVVIHLAAATNADACELHPGDARRSNVESTARLAKGAHDCRLFLYASTDLVFDGQCAPYRESDAAAPISVYGETKLDGERAARAALDERAVAVRLALMYGPRRRRESRPSFAETMLARARSGDPVVLFEDQFRTALYVEDAADNLIRLIEQAPSHPVIHLGGPERASRFEMGIVALDVFGIPRARASASFMSERPSKARRPRDVSLDSALAFGLGFRARGLREGFAAFRDTMKEPWLL